MGFTSHPYQIQTLSIFYYYLIPCKMQVSEKCFMWSTKNNPNKMKEICFLF